MTAKVEDVFEQLGDLFTQFFSYSPHVGVDLRITEDEAISGVTRTVDFRRSVPCGRCDGRGSPDPAASEPCPDCAGKGGHSQTQGFFITRTTCQRCHGVGRLVRDPCDACNGTATASEQATHVVEVPAGVEHQQRLKLDGRGSRKADGTVGDLFVNVLVGDRPDTRYAAFEQPLPEPELPRAHVHNAKRPIPVVPIFTIGFILVILVALATR